MQLQLGHVQQRDDKQEYKANMRTSTVQGRAGYVHLVTWDAIASVQLPRLSTERASDRSRATRAVTFFVAGFFALVAFFAPAAFLGVPAFFTPAFLGPVAFLAATGTNIHLQYTS